jgi:RNA polymerase sigma factor (TIGR02999 family)
MDAAPNLTQLLISYGQGNQNALEALLPEVYTELRRLAQSYMRKENTGHTLQATALVHEAFFRLIDQKQVQWQNRAQFFGVAAQLMRRILIDHARQRLAAKRGGSQARIAFDEAVHWTDKDEGPDLLALDQALEKLTLIDERQAKVVELRYFGGLSIEETAHVLHTSPATVKRDWTLAKAWLYRELGTEDEGDLGTDANA